MFISVKLIDYSFTTTITLPVVGHNELRKRINDFIKKRDIITHPLCKKLFQKNNCELAAFPQRKLDNTSVSCGDLLVCALSPEKGVVLCFIPSTEPPLLHYATMITKFQGRDYPNCSEASTCLLSKIAISFLACEEGMIGVDTSGLCTLQGLEISLLRYRNTHQTLFCKKITSNLLIQSPLYIMGEVSPGYILVDCISKEKDFCFQIGLPVLSQEEVAAKVSSARQAHAVASKKNMTNRDLRFPKIFPQVSSTHHVSSFPHSMFLSLPFGIMKGGKLLFSQVKNSGILECTIISDFFVSDKQEKVRHIATFYDWQIGSPSYIQTTQSTKSITCFSDSSITVVREKGSKKFFIVGAQVKLICSTRGIWGLCFFRDGTSSSELQEAATLISCTKKESNFVTEQGPSYRAQLSSDFDPGEGTSPHGSQSSSDFDPSEGTSTHGSQSSSDFDPSEGTSPHGSQSSSDFDPSEETSPHGSQSSSNFDPGEGTSQGAKKRSAACLELNFADQGPLCSSEHVPKKGNFKGIKSSTQVVLLSPCPLDDPNQRPLAKLTASMVKLPVDAVPLQSASFQLPDLPLFTLKESQKTTSDSNPFGLGTETEAFQDTMSSLITTSSRFFQQNSSSITYSESTSTTSLEISSISQEAKQSNEEIWEDLCAIIDAVPFQSASLQLPDVPSFILKESQKTTSDSDSDPCTMSTLVTTSSRFFQQNFSSITPAEIISTTNLKISSVSQESQQLNEETWEDLCSIVDAVPLQSASLQLLDVPSCILKESQKTTSDSNLYGAQLSLDCDPEEGPSQGATKRSDECLGLKCADQDLLWNSDCDPEESPFQGATKRSDECLGLKCADQDPLWNAAFNPPFSSSKYS